MQIRDTTTFFQSINRAPPQLHFLAGDCSLRRYYRFWDQDKPYILMDAPVPENPKRFIEIAESLIALGFSAPRIYDHCLNEGFLIIEDLEDMTFTRALQVGINETMLYELAVDTLIGLHQKITEPPLPLLPYSISELCREAGFGIEWYWQYCYKTPIPANLYADYLLQWENVFRQMPETPQTLVLRDFHVDNLVWLPRREGINRCGLLDFQDALWGSVTYDLVSLLEDARRDINPVLKDSLWKRYLAAFPKLNADDLQTTATTLSAGRHAKILAVFTRQHLLHKRPHYLVHLPRVWALLQGYFQHPFLGNVRAWFDSHLPSQVPHEN